MALDIKKIPQNRDDIFTCLGSPLKTRQLEQYKESYFESIFHPYDKKTEDDLNRVFISGFQNQSKDAKSFDFENQDMEGRFILSQQPRLKEILN